MFLHDTAQLGKLWFSSVFGSFIRNECLSFDSVVAAYGAITETLGRVTFRKTSIDAKCLPI